MSELSASGRLAFWVTDLSKRLPGWKLLKPFNQFADHKKHNRVGKLAGSWSYSLAFPSFSPFFSPSSLPPSLLPCPFSCPSHHHLCNRLQTHLPAYKLVFFHAREHFPEDKYDCVSSLLKPSVLEVGIDVTFEKESGVDDKEGHGGGF